VKIERATVNDLAALMRVCMSFFDETPYGKMMPRGDGEQKQAFAKLADLIADGIVFVARDDDGVFGAIGGSLSPFWWNDAALIASEWFWYVLPEKRGGTAAVRLIDAFEREGSSRGASWVAMQGGVDRSTADFLGRRGYMVHGPVCMKRIG